MNTTDKTNKILLNILKWGIYAALLTPLFVTRHFYFPFISTKVFYFQLLIEVLSVVWVVLLTRDIIRVPKWRDTLLWALGVHVVILAVGAAFGVEWHRSLRLNAAAVYSRTCIMSYFF